MPVRNILISGATGFVGQKLAYKLAAAGHNVSAFHRDRRPEASGDIAWIGIGDLASTRIDPAIGSGIDVFINLAAPIRPTSTDPGGLQSKAAAIAGNVSDFIAGAGIRRVIVMSSIAARLAEEDPAHARRYGVEKLAADRIFQERLNDRHHVVFLRPPAIYGPAMQGSIHTLAALVRKGLPIPLGAATEPRHYLSAANLCDLVETIVQSEDERWAQAAGKFFEPSDGQAVATRKLVQMMGSAMGRRARMLPVPVMLLRALGAVTGRSEMISGAIDRLDVAAPEELERHFGWRPIEQMPESLAFLANAVSRA
jgi:UDP-glucose 4-epimerase